MSALRPRVVLARHAETAWSLAGRHTGRTDLPLTARGEAAARALGVRLEGLRFSHVLTSPLQRAHRTCELAGFGDRADADPDLMEWDYGDFEGRTADEVRREHPGWDVFRHGSPGGESVAEVTARVDRVIARLSRLRGPVLVFGHGHLSRALAARWIGLGPAQARNLVLATGAVSILSSERSLGAPAIELWNDTGHIPDRGGPESAPEPVAGAERAGQSAPTASDMDPNGIERSK